MQNSTPKTSKNCVQIGPQKRPQKRCKTHLIFDPGRFSRENPLGDPKTEQKSTQNDPQIGAKMDQKCTWKKIENKCQNRPNPSQICGFERFPPPPKRPPKTSKKDPQKDTFLAPQTWISNDFAWTPPFEQVWVPKRFQNKSKIGSKMDAKTELEKASKKYMKKSPKRRPKKG